MAVTMYRVKVGDQWAMGGERGDTTPKLTNAKLWKRLGDAKSHIKNVRSRGRYAPETYTKCEPAIVPCQVVDCPPDHAAVSLPTNDPVLADYLESIGYLDAANALRGV